MSITTSSPILDGIDVPHVTAYLGASNWTRRASFPRGELIGLIVKLSTVNADFSAPQNVVFDNARIATLRFTDERGGRQHAKMSLGADDYRIACEAHRDKKLVTVRGRLEREGKQWRISGVREFGTVDRSTDIEQNRLVKGVMDR